MSRELSSRHALYESVRVNANYEIQSGRAYRSKFITYERKQMDWHHIMHPGT
jgi:hypothetical protein